MTDEEFRRAVRKLVNDKLDEYFDLEDFSDRVPAIAKMMNMSAKEISEVIDSPDMISYAAEAAADWIAEKISEEMRGRK